MGASAVAIWCLAVARAAPSVAYLRLPLPGHLEALSIPRPSDNFHHLLSACSMQNLSRELFERQTNYWPTQKKRAVILRDASFASRRISTYRLRLPFKLRSFAYPHRIGSG